MKKAIIWACKTMKPKFDKIGFIDDNGGIHINPNPYQPKHQVIHFLLNLHPGSSLYITQGESSEQCVYKWNQKEAIERVRKKISIAKMIDDKFDEIINSNNGLCFIRMENIRIREYSELPYIPYHRYSWLKTSIDIGYYNPESDGCTVSCIDKLIPEFLIRNSVFLPLRLSL